jgi:hypothetical protein
MKVVGEIRAEFIDEEGHVNNPDYVGGLIVQLTQQEAATLKQLQDVWDGLGWDIKRLMGNHIPSDIKMDNMFCAVRLFVEAKLAVNELKDEVDKLNNILVDLEKDNDVNK